MKLFRTIKIFAAVLIAWVLHRRGWTTQWRVRPGHCHLCGRPLKKPFARFCPKQRCIGKT